MTELAIRPAVFDYNGVAMTNSRYVAEYFGKRHDNMLRAIGRLRRLLKNKERYFRETDYVGRAGRTDPAYDMTRDGFSLMVMGFTGERALQWKLEFLAEFDRMQQTLEQLPALPAPITSTTPRLSGALLREVDRTIEHMQSRFELSAASLQTFASQMFARIGVMMPEPRVEKGYSTSDLAERWDMSPSPFGKRVKHLKTEEHGEYRLTTATSGKQVSVFVWNQRGCDAVARLMEDTLKVLPFHVRE